MMQGGGGRRGGEGDGTAGGLVSGSSGSTEIVSRCRREDSNPRTNLQRGGTQK